jgi:MFS family permease
LVSERRIPQPENEPADEDAASPADAAEGTWLTRPFVSLSYRAFRFFWLSNLIVALGLMVQFTAQGWLVVQLTDSALLLGLVEGLFGLAFAAGSIPMGVIADRYNRRDLLLLDNFIALLAAAAIGTLAVTGTIQIWHIVCVSLLGGLLMSVRFPASQAMVVRLVPGRHLMNATSLNTASSNLPNIAGPALGGVLIGVVGIGAAYFVTTGALAVALVMLMLGVAASFGHVEQREAQSVTADLREAWDYLVGHRDLLKLTAVMLIPFMMGQSFVLLLPLFVEQELDGSAMTFGLLSACLGAGGVLGAMLVATFGEQRQIGVLMFVGVLSVGIGATMYGLSPWIALTGAALLAAGAGQSVLFAAYETYLLIRLPDEMRGRVMGLTFTMVAFFPVSAVLAGALSDVIGLRAVAVIEGVVIILLAGLAWWSVLRSLVVDETPATQAG